MRTNLVRRSAVLGLIAGLAAALAGCATPGVTAAVHRDPAGLQKVLDRPGHGGENLDNLLGNAVAFDCPDCVRILLQNGAKSDERLLSAAAVAGHEQTARLLIDAGADPAAAMTSIHRDTRKWPGGCCLSPEQAETAGALFKKLDRERDSRAPAVPAPVPPVPSAPAPQAVSESSSSTAVGLPQLRDEPPFHEAARPDDYAVIVGIEKYDGLPSAPAAGDDAEAADAYLKGLGVPMRHIFIVGGAYATRSRIAKELEGRLPDEVDANSTVYFYYAGLGATDSKSGRAYLVPFDGDPRYLEQTAYPLKRLYEKLGALKVKRVIVILDTAFSGAGARTVLAKGAEPRAGAADDGFNSVDGKIALLAAADADQGAGTDAKNEHGLFTSRLMKGLGGAAKNSAGETTLKSLFDYVKAGVRDDARRGGREQVPQYRSGGTATDRVVLRSK